MPNKNIGLNHCIGSGVVAERLYFESVIAVPGLTISTVVDFICIDVEPTVRADIAKPEVVTSHCRVVAPIKRRNIGISKIPVDECASVEVVEQDAVEAECLQWCPAVKAFTDIPR